MRIRRTIATGVVLAAVTAAVASTAGASTAALVMCGKVTAAGKSWKTAAAGVPCAVAVGVVRRVAVAKADHVLHHGPGGEIDQYGATFSGLKCLKAVSPVEMQIQCGNANGKQTVLAIYKR